MQGESAPTVRVANSNPKYPVATIPADPAAPVDQSAGVHWQQYVQVRIMRYCGNKCARTCKYFFVGDSIATRIGCNTQ